MAKSSTKLYHAGRMSEPTPKTVSDHRADYVIVGAGSAGCVLANRLSASGRHTVLLIEAGDRNDRLISRMPSAFYLPMRDPRMNWGFESTPQSHLNGRRLACPRGRGLGGSSAINGMVYVRGHAQDFDTWQSLGATGWSARDVAPFFTLALDNLTVVNGRQTNPLYERFLTAAQEAGHPVIPDLNGGRQEGFGPLPMTVDHGIPASTARAYLAPARHRSNLSTLTHCHVERITSDAKPTLEARLGSRKLRIEANRELILSAGAIQSPQLLMRSGIGPGDHLQSLGIPVRHDVPEVGSNLMDHLEVYVQQACTQPVSLYGDLNPLGKARIGLEWLLRRSGLGATNHFETGGFIRSSQDAPYPDIQFHFLPAAMNYDGSAQAARHGYQAHVGPMLSDSRGTVRLESPDPDAAPLIDFNYMATDGDWRVFRAAIRAAREIFAQAAFDDVRGPEIAPGESAQSDAALDEFIKTHAESAYHPCGTCRMGSDADAVVDPAGRLQGIENVRVCDASIFPRITNGNLNAPVIMVAEKIADAILRER